MTTMLLFLFRGRSSFGVDVVFFVLCAFSEKASKRQVFGFWPLVLLGSFAWLGSNETYSLFLIDRWRRIFSGL